MSGRGKSAASLALVDAIHRRHLSESQRAIVATKIANLEAGDNQHMVASIEATSQDRAHIILAEIQPASVRAVCYRLFTLGLIDSMAKSETNRVSSQLTWARETGVIPWQWIVDETREAERISAWANPAEYIEVVKRSYRRDRWTDQPDRIEVWSEKGTIRGTIAPVLQEFGVAFRVMHGYGSTTAVHQAAMDSLVGDKKLTVLYVGDWDPSGLHMSDVDLPRRLREYGGDVDLVRLALTEEDTVSGLPFFLAETKKGNDEKKGDPRYTWYVDHYGLKCWELDALSPVILRDRVKHAVTSRLDQAAWDRADVVERAEQESLTSILSAWPGISRQAQEYDGGRP